MSELNRVIMTAGGTEIGTLAEMQDYTYSVGEGEAPPPIVTRMIAGEDVDPAELYAALDGQARDAVFPEDAGIAVIEELLSRLRAAFPGLSSRCRSGTRMNPEVSIGVKRSDFQVDRLFALFAQLHDHQLTAAPELAGMPPRSAGEAWPRRSRRYGKWLAEDDAFLVEAQCDDGLIGFALVTVGTGYDGWVSGERIGELHELVVAVDHRGGGVGRALITTVRATLTELGVSELRVALIAANESAERFYQDLGFELVGKTMLLASPAK